jgi:hypothetical protein
MLEIVGLELESQSPLHISPLLKALLFVIKLCSDVIVRDRWTGELIEGWVRCET